ncbi:MAG: hypothetical protein Q4A22_04265 [Kocuria sp.]|nr:hypothetical protein [Kocuria sp.]MDO4918732.1 hypothetical protein [Kocuria sp.]
MPPTATPHTKPHGAPIAETILLPGDPLRATFIAETLPEDAVQFSAVRNMLGYTGTHRGRELSVMGTGIPSIAPAVLTVSDNHVTRAELPPEQRQTGFATMIERATTVTEP